MKAWEIHSYQHPDWPEPHPAVIVSHPERVALKPEVTILLCSSKTATHPAKPHEVILDRSDGLDWPTLCKCDLLYTLPKAALGAYRGTVTAERRRQLSWPIVPHLSEAQARYVAQPLGSALASIETT